MNIVANMLPNSPPKRSKVIRTLAKKYEITMNNQTHKGGGHNKISDETHDAVKNYYCHDDNCKKGRWFHPACSHIYPYIK